MKPDAEGLLGVFTAVLLAGVLLLIVQTVSFPMMPSVYSPQTANPGDLSTVGQQMSSFLWRYRGLDLVAQAVLLFASAIGCLAMLRRAQERR